VARVVLVHGAFTGAFIWEPLMERLRTLGHTVAAPDLPGLGDDQTPASEVTLDACAARICDVLVESTEPAFVVGNSMGGLIATQAAARCPDRIAALVYVAAFLPHDGQSLLQLTQLPEGTGDQVQANIVIEGDPPRATMPAAASRDALYGSCSDEAARWAIERQRPQPLGPFATPVAIPRGALDLIPKFYVVCALDRAIPAALQRRMSREGGCVEVVELDADHTPQLSKTAELADALDGFVRRAATMV
jgi:pimeloyl-ACP methyl ester carboxylesterase